MTAPAPDSSRSGGRPALRARLLTAGVLAPAMLAAIWWLPPPAVGVLLGAFLAVGAWEWADLIGWSRPRARFLYAAIALLLAAAAYPLAGAAGPFGVLLLAALGGWACALGAVVGRQCGRDPMPTSAAAWGVLGWLLLVMAWLSLVWLAVRDPRLLVGLFALVWLADTLAYFAGRRFGRRRLASEVSPGKTWAGFAAAVLGVPLLAAAAALVADLPAGRVLGVALVTVAASVVGDLFESLMKRRRGVKDSGSLLPGHGGMLDRIDSLLAAGPWFVFGLLNTRLVA